MIALYSRVSTQEQAQDGYSIGEQEKRLQSYCDALGLKPCRLYTDAGYSGGSTDRPALQNLIHDVKSGMIEKVIVFKLDRLSRSQKDTLELIEDVFLNNGCDFISISENFDTATPLGRAMIGILAVFAQLEREQIKERMFIGKEARAKEGKWHGGASVPIGYRLKDTELEIDPYEALQVREVFDLYRAGKGLSTIEQTMFDKGYSYKAGTWNRSTIRRVLKNAIYIGKINYNGKVIDGHHEPIISQETFDSTQILLSERSQKQVKHSSTYLGGLLYCKKCGARYGVHHASGKYIYYKCYSRSKPRPSLIHDPDCKNKTWKMSELDSIVFDEIKKLKLDPSLFKDAPQEDNKEALINEEIKKIDAQRSKFLDLYGLGGFTVEELQSKIEPLTAQKKRLTDELQALANHEKNLERKKEMIRSFSDVFDLADHDTIRAIITELIEKIEIDDDDVYIHWNI